MWPIDPVTVLGFAETATGLGHCVADELDARYLHSTRRPVAGMVAAAGFEEVHSHATSHLLLPRSPNCFRVASRWFWWTTNYPPDRRC